MQKRRNGEQGATAIEYIVFLALVLLAAIAAIGSVGHQKGPTMKESPGGGGLLTVGSPHNGGVDLSASPALSPDARATPGTSRVMPDRTTDAPPAFRISSTPTPTPAMSRTSVPAAQSTPPPTGFEPPHRGPPDSG